MFNVFNEENPENRIEKSANEDGLGVTKAQGKTPLEPKFSAYKNDPRFQQLLEHFQYAEWEVCLRQLNDFLARYPEDEDLLAFKQDVEVRIQLQESNSISQRKENREKGLKIAARSVLIAFWAVLVGAFFIWAINAYSTYTTKIRLEQETAAREQLLSTKYQTAEGYLSVGKFEEAMLLYQEVSSIRSGYLDVDEKIRHAQELIDVKTLYQQGQAAFWAGEQDKALKIMQDVEARFPGYEEAAETISKIQTAQQIAQLAQELQIAYGDQNYQGVVSNYEAIREIEPSINLPELDNILFVSYRSLIIEIAGRADASLEEIERAERYYRAALALAPQDKKYAAEREELNTIAVGLLANKYYLRAMDLLESSNYSLSGTREALRALNRAYGIGSGSVVIREGRDKTQLFYDSYDAFLRRNWDEAIQGFENLRRQEETYGNGFVNYLLFESYLVRGDSLMAYADYAGALNNYQEAEKYAWASEETTPARFFQIESRIAKALGKLWRAQEALEFYRYVFERMNYQRVLTSPEQQALLATIESAQTAARSGNQIEALRLYELAVESEPLFYQYNEVSVMRGDTLAYMAFKHGATLESLRKINSLGESMIFNTDQKILVPMLPGK